MTQLCFGRLYPRFPSNVLVGGCVANSTPRIVHVILSFALFSALQLVALPKAHAQTEIVLYNFCSQLSCIEGENPASSLKPDGSGNLYGTTQAGGANGQGTVFELSRKSGGGYNEVVVYSFCSLLNCTDGNNPTSNVIFDGVGNLYGTTCSGGANGQGVASACGNSSDGYGVVFKLSPEPRSGCRSGSNTGNGWCETVLYSFKSNTDGAFPFSGLTRDPHGNLFGTTYRGGNGSGVVYELSPAAGGSWNETVLYSICSQPGCIDGAYPSGLLRTANGNLYGTTENGGAYGLGTVFELNPEPENGCLAGSYTGNGWCEVILHAFAGQPADGEQPAGTPVIDNAGSLYGTTIYGGRGSCDFKQGCGTVWKLAFESGIYTEEILHPFSSGPGNFGCCSPIRLSHYPWAGVVLDPSGNVYGTTAYGGSTSYCTEDGGGSYQGCGTLFELTKGAKDDAYEFELLWVFDWTNGADPITSLSLVGGKLFGTTYLGGPGSFCPSSNGCGVAFVFSP